MPGAVDQSAVLIDLGENGPTIAFLVLRLVILGDMINHKPKETVL